ncbi:MAG: protocatechuate 3,4-dioxygenase subunit beta [Marmoricola sp.]
MSSRVSETRAGAPHAPAAGSDAAAASQEQISTEIAAIRDDYQHDHAARAGRPEPHTRVDYAPYRSSVLRHPTRDAHHADPETIELSSPAFGERDVAPVEADLTAQHRGEPLGERIVVAGRLVDGDGRPVRNQLVEVWQANAAGRYIHKRDQHPAPLDPNFTGAGRTLTDADGNYRFLTIKPGPYPWKNHQNAWRPAHIHFSLFGTDFTQRLVTQMYFPGDPLFGLDPIFCSVVDPRVRELLVATYDHGLTRPELATGYRWDIVLTGSLRTPSEEAE